jgi:hypothetical protein
MIDRHGAELSELAAIFEARPRLELLDAGQKVYWWNPPDRTERYTLAFADWPPEFGASIVEPMRVLLEAGVWYVRRDASRMLQQEHVAFIFGRDDWSETIVYAAYAPYGLGCALNSQEMPSLTSRRWLTTTESRTLNWHRVRDDWYVCVEWR